MHPETYALLVSVRKVARDMLDALEELGGSDLQRLTRAQERTYAVAAKWMSEHPLVQFCRAQTAAGIFGHREDSHPETERGHEWCEACGDVQGNSHEFRP